MSHLMDPLPERAARVDPIGYGRSRPKPGDRRRRVLAWQLRIGDEIETIVGAANVELLELGKGDQLRVGVVINSSDGDPATGYWESLYDAREPVTVVASHGERWGVTPR